MTQARYTSGNLLRDYWIYLNGKRTKFVFWTAMRALASSASFAVAFLLGASVDLLAQGSNDVLWPFLWMVMGIAIAGIFRVWMRFAAKFQMYQIGMEIRKDLRVLAMSKMIDLDLSWHEKEDTGSKLQRINNGSEQVFQGIKKFANVGVEIIVGIVGSMILFIALDFKYVIFAIAYSVIYLSGEYYFDRRLFVLEDRLNAIKEKVSGKFHESAANMMSVKSLGLDDSFKKSTLDYENEFQDMWLVKRKASQTRSKTIKIFGAVGYATFVLMTGLDVMSGLLSVGLLLTYTNYFGKLRQSLFEVTHNMADFIEIRSGVGRFSAIIGLKTRDSSTGKPLPRRWDSIRFAGVTFRYREKDVLNNFSLTVPRGKKIGVVGQSGCGKSTLTKLMLGLYEPTRGAVLLGNTRIGEIKRRELTREISIVLQDSEIFNMSLKENITLGVDEDRARLAKAITASVLKPVIDRLPKGIETVVGEKGYKLSGGERQRIGIARAIYKDSQALILDEATSSLDSRTEKAIHDNIEKLKGKTVITIAHRLSTLRLSDVIYVLDKGKIAEAGTYDDLIARKGIFFRLHRLQKR